MYIRASDTQRAHGRSRPPVRARPLLECCVYGKRARLQFEPRIRFLEIQSWRDLAMLQRQNRFDQAGDTGGIIQMADVGLHRTQKTELLLIREGAVRLRQRTYLDRIAEGSSAAMCFDITNG